MQAIINNDKFLVNWRYESPLLNHLLGEKNITLEAAHKMKKADLKELLGVQSLPLPSVITCTISDETGEERHSHRLELEHDQRYNKEVMRKSSMATVLEAMFPGREDKDKRKAFYDSYRSRKAPQGLKKFFKLFKKYEGMLEENLEREEAENNVVVSL